MLVDAMSNWCSHLGSDSENRGIIWSIEKDGEVVVYTDMEEGATNVQINSVVHILTNERPEERSRLDSSRNFRVVIMWLPAPNSWLLGLHWEHNYIFPVEISEKALINT